MRVKTTKPLRDSWGNEVPAGTEIEVREIPKGPHSVIAGRVEGGRRFVGVDEHAVERIGKRGTA